MISFKVGSLLEEWFVRFVICVWKIFQAKFLLPWVENWKDLINEHEVDKFIGTMRSDDAVKNISDWHSEMALQCLDNSEANAIQY